MKSSFVTLGFFLVGCMAGTQYMVNFDVHEASICVLYFLMILIGISLGSNENLKEVISQLTPKMLLVPLATVTGTVIFTAIGGFLLSRWSAFDCMAVGSGFAY